MCSGFLVGSAKVESKPLFANRNNSYRLYSKLETFVKKINNECFDKVELRLKKLLNYF